MLPIVMTTLSDSAASKRAGGELRVHVKPDGTMWAPAEAYAKLLGGKVELQQDGQLVVLCVGDLCVPLRVGEDAEVIGGRHHLRLERLASALRGAPSGPEAASGLRPGDAAPDFTLRSLDGAPVSLRDYRGRKVLVFAWASW